MSYDLTDFQRLTHAVPESYSRFLGGGRGGGKSEFIAQDVAFVAERYRQDARILYIRQGPYKSMRDFIGTAARFFDRLWGPRAHHLNQGDHVWTLPTGAYFELGILPDGEHGRRYYETTYQGRSMTHIWVDEAQQFARVDVLDMLLSNLRGSIPTRIGMGANPGGIGHQWIVQRFIHAAEAWSPYDIERKLIVAGETIETCRSWINCPSTYRDNPNCGQDYLDNLATSCGDDMELLAAWLSGNWDIARGAYFASALANQEIRVDWPEPEAWEGWKPYDWQWFLTYDHGTEAPAACYVVAKSPGAIGPDGRFYPADSYVFVDEYACHRPNDFGRSYGWDVGQLSVPIKALAQRWAVPPTGIADEYAQFGIYWRSAQKGLRAPRFLKMRRLLRQAGSFEFPGLYISGRCHYWWNTVPFLVHDPIDREVPMKCDTDHGADATSMAVGAAAAQSGIIAGVT